MGSLKELMVSVTNNCNLRCRMCEIPRSHKKDLLSTKDFETLFRDFSEMGFHKKGVVLSGGEPLMRRDIFDIISSASSLGIFTYLPSNGTLITKLVAKKLRNAGVDVVNISVEGPRGIHDSLRGQGTFDKAINAIKNLNDQNINTTIATTVLNQNYDKLAYVLELAKDLEVTTVMFQPFNKIFIPNYKKEDFWIDDTKKLNRTINDIINLSNRYFILVNHKKYLRNMISYFLNTYYPRGKKCLMIEESCAINHNGDIYVCWPRTNFLLGNLKKERIKHIWNSRKHKLIKKMIKESKCPNNCLMSCHENNFNKWKLLNPGFYNKLKKILKQKKKSSKIKNLDISKSLNELTLIEQQFKDKVGKL